VDSRLWPVTGGRGALDVVARLKKILPPGVTLRELRLTEPGGGRRSDREREVPDRARVAVNVRGRGLVIGEVENDDATELRLAGQQPVPKNEIVGDVVRWPSSVREVTLVGEIDENIRGGPRDTLNTLKEQL